MAANHNYLKLSDLNLHYGRDESTLASYYFENNQAGPDSCSTASSIESTGSFTSIDLNTDPDNIEVDTGLIYCSHNAVNVEAEPRVLLAQLSWHIPQDTVPLNRKNDKNISLRKLITRRDTYSKVRHLIWDCVAHDFDGLFVQNDSRKIDLRGAARGFSEIKDLNEHNECTRQRLCEKIEKLLAAKAAN